MKYIEYNTGTAPKELLENPLPEGTQAFLNNEWCDETFSGPLAGRSFKENPPLHSLKIRIPIEHWIKTLKQDDLVEVSDDLEHWYVRYYSHTTTSINEQFHYTYCNGESSNTIKVTIPWRCIRPLSVQGFEQSKFSTGKSVESSIPYKMHIPEEENMNKIQVTDGFWLTKGGYVIEIKDKCAVNKNLCPGLNFSGKSVKTLKRDVGWGWKPDGTIGSMDKKSTEDLQLVEKLDIEGIPDPPSGYRHYGGYPTYRYPKKGEYYLSNTNLFCFETSEDTISKHFIFEPIKKEESIKENIPKLPEGFEWEGGVPTKRLPRIGDWYVENDGKAYKSEHNFTNFKFYIVKPLKYVVKSPNPEEIPQKKEKEMKDSIGQLREYMDSLTKASEKIKSEQPKKRKGIMSVLMVIMWTIVSALFRFVVVDTLKMAVKPTLVTLRVGLLAAMIGGTGYFGYNNVWPAAQNIYNSMPTLVWPDQEEEVTE